MSDYRRRKEEKKEEKTKVNEQGKERAENERVR
jgi:hypothetical protein